MSPPEDEFETGRLFELYTRYVTEPESKRDVYGYTVLIIGYLLGMAGMIIYLVGPTSGPLDPTTALFREVAFATAGIGLISTLFGIILMLPVERPGVIAGGIGTLLGLSAAAWFVVAYPGNWSVGQPDYSSAIITIYTIGAAMVAGVVVLVPVATGERSYFAAAAEALGRDHPDVLVGRAPRGGLFSVFQEKSEWTWRLVDQSAVAASSEKFLSRLETEDQVERIKDRVEEASLLEITHAAFRLYKAGEDRWRWLLMQENGNVVADSGDEFASRSAAEGSMNNLKEFGPTADVITVEDAAFEPVQNNGSWRWRLVDEGHHPIAEGYRQHRDKEAVRESTEAAATAMADAPVLTVDSYGIELFEESGDWQLSVLASDLNELGKGVSHYESKGRVEDAAYDLLERLPGAPIIDTTAPSFDLFEPLSGQWRWRLVTPEGRPIAVDTESGGSAQVVESSAEAFKASAHEAETVEIRDQDFELYEVEGAWHWRLVDADRNVRAHSVESYASRSDAADGLEHVRRHVPDADLIEFETAAFQLYESDGGRWRWRLIDEDGNVLADSSEGEYESKDGAASAMSTLQEYAPDAEQLEIETAAFELFEESGRWGWRLVDDLGETIARGTRRYESRGEAEADMDTLRDEVEGVDVRVMDAGVFQVYHDVDEAWWWRFILPDGSEIASSPDSFGTRHEAEDAIEDIQETSINADIVDVGRLAVLLERVGDQWTWVLANHERDHLVESTHQYDSETGARDEIAEIQSAGDSITVFEIRDASFLVTSGEGWEWMLIDEGHERIASSTSGHDTPDAAERAVNRISELAVDAPFIDFEQAAFEVNRSDDGWRWHLIDEDRGVIAAGADTYASSRAVEDTIETVREELPDASIIEIERAAFEFQEVDSGWRWRLIDETGTELAASLESYESRTAAREAIETVQEFAPDAWVSVAD